MDEVKILRKYNMNRRQMVEEVADVLGRHLTIILIK